MQNVDNNKVYRLQQILLDYQIVFNFGLVQQTSISVTARGIHNNTIIR